ncbi:MAG: hypothetical protein VX028_00705 [Nanoarchaeota archaeon]|nr:hypothetical protein [Nanoarchaeota archaeon]
MDIFDFKKFYVTSLHELHKNSDSFLGRLESEIYYSEDKTSVANKHKIFFSHFQKALDDHLSEVFNPMVVSSSQEVQEKAFFMIEDYILTNSEIKEQFSPENFNSSFSSFYLSELNRRINSLARLVPLPCVLERQKYLLVEVSEDGVLNFNTN